MHRQQIIVLQHELKNLNVDIDIFNSFIFMLKPPQEDVSVEMERRNLLMNSKA